MSERKIVVPEGLLKAAAQAQGISAYPTKQVVEAILGWLSENPVVPSVEQTVEMMEKFPINSCRNVCVEWQRRMFLAPEPYAPFELIDLLWQGKVVTPADESIKENDRRIIEAYRRGRESK